MSEKEFHYTRGTNEHVNRACYAIVSAIRCCRDLQITYGFRNSDVFKIILDIYADDSIVRTHIGDAINKIERDEQTRYRNIDK